MSPLSSSHGFLHFGEFDIDLRAGELRKNGIRIKLQVRPFQVLQILLEDAGEVVTREELRKRIWPADTFVDFDQGLNTAINKLRSALGDDAEKPRFIETLAKRGYRFIAPIEGLENGARPSAGVPPTDAARRRVKASVAVIGLGLTALLGVTIALNVGRWRKQVLARSAAGQIQSLVVLPLENLSGDPAQEYFADGITDQLTTNLAQIGALRVISRTSAMQYRGTRKTLPQIAQELHVDAVVEGTIARSGDRVRINAQLIHAATDRHIWANSYERDQKDIVALQNDVARAIADEIQIKLTPEEQLRLSRARAVNPEVYEEYLQGLYAFNKDVTTKTFTNAAEHFQNAIEKDPGYASAHAGLAASYAALGLLGALSPREMNSKAKSAAERALVIDETLAQAHSALGLVLYYDWDWPGTDREFKGAIRANPSDVWAHVGYSWYLAAIGQFDQAVAEADRAQQVDPLSLMANWNVANVLIMARQYDGALEKCRSVLKMNPNFARGHLTMMQIYLGKGLYKEAIAEFQAIAQVEKPDRHRLAYIYAASGDKRKARKLLAQALQEKRNEGDLHEIAFASVYAALGDKDEAFEWLEQAYENHNYTLAHVKWDPLWDPIRSDPRFKDLVRSMAFPQ